MYPQSHHLLGETLVPNSILQAVRRQYLSYVAVRSCEKDTVRVSLSASASEGSFVLFYSLLSILVPCCRRFTVAFWLIGRRLAKACVPLARAHFACPGVFNVVCWTSEGLLLPAVVIGPLYSNNLYGQEPLRVRTFCSLCGSALPCFFEFS